MAWNPTERIVCPCGGSYTKSNKSKHFNTKWHKKLFEFIQANSHLNTEALRTKCEALKTPQYKHKVINVVDVVCSPYYKNVNFGI